LTAAAVLWYQLNLNPTMKIKSLHRWDVSPRQAREIQERLRHRVVVAPLPSRPRLVAGVDVACPAGGGTAIAGVVVHSLPGLDVVERRSAAGPLEFPYVPGLLSFREGPVVLSAIRALESEPDVFLFDGQGICHPRRFGLASHLGVILDRPTVGCAKSLLVGTHSAPGLRRGCRRRILDRGEPVGLALRTREGVRPVYVSVGHRADLPGAARLVLSCARRYRIPEPLREAHRWVGELGRAGAAPPAAPRAAAC